MNILSKIDPTINKLEKIPKVYRIVICVVLFLLPTGLMIWLSYYPKWEEIKKLEGELAKLEAELKEVKLKASKLKEIQEDIRKAEEEFNVARRALPEKEEIPSFLISISHSGQDAGLDFPLFRPGKETSEGFYAENPVAIQIVGTYHNVVKFCYKISKLPRIVHIKDIRMTPMAGDNNKLSVSCTAVIYMFVETQEVPEKK